MKVLTIIGILIFIYVVYKLVQEFNEYTYDKYRYEFFDMSSYLIIAISYIFLYFGNNIYRNALASNGDILNGQILIFIGLIGLIFMFIVNLKNTNFLIGIIGTIFQFILYSVLAVVGIFALLLAIAFFSETKPVYTINDGKW